jgi:hypothetical protein
VCAVLLSDEGRLCFSCFIKRGYIYLCTVQLHAILKVNDVLVKSEYYVTEGAICILASKAVGQPLHPMLNCRHHNEGSRALKGRYGSYFWVSFESVTDSEFTENFKVLFSC